MSACCVLISLCSGQAFISIKVFDYRAFNYILHIFASIYDRCAPYRYYRRIKMESNSRLGRKRSIGASISLGLFLFRYRTRGSISVQCMLSGVTHSVCTIFFLFLRRVLVKFLSKCPLSRMRILTKDNIKLYSGVINSKYDAKGFVCSCRWPNVAAGTQRRFRDTGDVLQWLESRSLCE